MTQADNGDAIDSELELGPPAPGYKPWRLVIIEGEEELNRTKEEEWFELGRRRLSSSEWATASAIAYITVAGQAFLRVQKKMGPEKFNEYLKANGLPLYSVWMAMETASDNPPGRDMDLVNKYLIVPDCDCAVPIRAHDGAAPSILGDQSRGPTHG